MTNVDLIEKKDLREQMIGRVEVLDKVKDLLLIPETNSVTMNIIANYYQVTVEVVKKCYQRNKFEINQDGVLKKRLTQLRDEWKGHNVTTVTSQTKVIFQYPNMTIEVPNAGILLFSKRSVLRFGMLLRDSKIAQEVRTQLLNTFEHSTEEQRTADIDEEKILWMEIGKASMSGNVEQINLAYANAFAFKNRHIAKLEATNAKLETVNELLTRKTMEWGDRAILNALIRTLAANCFHGDFRNAWNALYRSIKYKYSIDVHSRKGDGKLIDKIKEDEFSNVISMAVSLCESNKIDIAKAINEINETNVRTA